MLPYQVRSFIWSDEPSAALLEFIGNLPNLYVPEEPKKEVNIISISFYVYYSKN